MSAIIDKITRQTYGWTMDKPPIGYSPSREHWITPYQKRRKFLTTNFRFTNDGRKIKVIS